jgi:hypothetical protein
MLHKALLKVRGTKRCGVPYIINISNLCYDSKKDKGRIGKMFAMVAISDYTIVGVGNTMREALTCLRMYVR